VFLAWGCRLPDGDLVVYTEQTIVDRSALAAEIAKVAERGWAQAVGEREEDLNAVAAPVRDAAGRLRAVLGVQGPSLRFPPTRHARRRRPADRARHPHSHHRLTPPRIPKLRPREWRVGL